MHFYEISYKHLERSAIADDYIQWAVELVESGSANKCLIDLAALYLECSHDLEIVQRHFEDCLKDLELYLPSDEYDAILKYAAYICELMVNEKITAENGIKILYDFGETYDFILFYIWIDLSCDLSSLTIDNENHTLINSELKTQDRNSFVRQVATQFITLCNIELPKRFPCIAMCEHCWSVANPIGSWWDGNESYSSCTCGKVGPLLNMRQFSSRESFLSKSLTNQSR